MAVHDEACSPATRVTPAAAQLPTSTTRHPPLLPAAALARWQLQPAAAAAHLEAQVHWPLAAVVCQRVPATCWLRLKQRHVGAAPAAIRPGEAQKPRAPRTARALAALTHRCSSHAELRPVMPLPTTATRLPEAAIAPARHGAGGPDGAATGNSAACACCARLGWRCVIGARCWDGEEAQARAGGGGAAVTRPSADS